MDLSGTTINDTNSRITYGGSDCSNINTANLNAVTCTLPLNNGNPIIEAGDNKPIIEITDYGFVDTNSVIATSVEIVI